MPKQKSVDMEQLNYSDRIKAVDWDSVTESMNDRGYAVLPELVSKEECLALINNYNTDALYRKTITMERYRFGLGEYKYFAYPLPELIQQIREEIYPLLSPIANKWMEVLRKVERFPASLKELHQLCHSKGQKKPTPLILKYGRGGYNTLHQDLYGDIFFPIQAVLFLNEPESDYTGGEFVMTEQRPRAQSKAIVLKPGRGGLLIFTTNFRPVKGSKGYYQVKMKHGVSEIEEGQRHTLGIIFHDAL